MCRRNNRFVETHRLRQSVCVPFPFCVFVWLDLNKFHINKLMVAGNGRPVGRLLVGLSVVAAASSRRSIVLPVAAARGVRYVTSCGTQSSVDTAMGHTVALLHRSNTLQNRLQRNLKHCRIYLHDTIARSSPGVMRGRRRYIHTLGTLSCAQREPSTSINYKTGMIMNFKCIVLLVGTSGWQPANTHTGRN